MSNNPGQPEQQQQQQEQQQPRKHLGLEAALEQERLEILGLLNHSRRQSSGTTQRHRQSATVTAPVRSLLDVSPGALPPRHGSIAGIGVGVTPPSPRESGSGARVWNEPASSPLRLSSSATSSTFHGDSEGPPRRSSDGTDQMSQERKKLVDKTNAKSGVNPHSGYQFDMSSTPNVSDHGSSKRAAQPQEKPPSKAVQSKSAMASVMSGIDLRVGLPSFARGRDSGRRSSTRGTSLDRFPSRFGRSSSPKNRLLNNGNSNNNSLNLSKPGTLVTDKGKVIDMDNAYKHLSDAALANSTGSLASLPKPASRRTSSEGDGLPAQSPADERLEKDMYDSENNPIDTSEDENEETSSSDDEASSGTETRRGRKISFDIIQPQETESSEKSEPQSQLAAAEEERQMVEDKLSATSISEPKPVTTTKQAPPSPPKPAKKPDVHPQTSFESVSAVNTPFGSDDEAELSDIKRAQKLSIQMSTINNTVHNRAIRTIIRGNYSSMQEEEGGRRRQRKYLVATDLSEESVYALEWTIGTILRDGDTMFAVCAVHEEATAGSSVQIGEGAKAMEDAAAVVGSQTETVQRSLGDASMHLPRALFGRLGSGSESKPSSVDARGLSKAESDRVHAAEVISQTCVRLLRKTALQVRIAVEVIHCKSPKHMITEAIDGLAPTLVIVGARGRSALKGVLLGSFSNYLVTNSSVPVMVARKKLKKQTKNKKTSHIRLSNNLTTPKKLAMAKVD
ncbi:hypothetical protein ASPWEDRAFT_175715 [Aspergillus wentii DTO 134E9]|uniref:UspA domain-containing protein n=1 Tax=Aspergillus wentii DTO 134E9 TaxID=1073089 RepID=A0A1L9RBY4_ASPWE|nr:uncharacterized protein ASPWEDRAFT_175715 [Aspergillus wentii DTO 134E9]KAI9934996.1 hypothetical protein MW887_000617 [Aspergillus wentii]OJJ32439.1 hypothetical protein ASPWEDRAFT_175715 [Aspergillus wentii DTO 134E9]